MFVAAFAAGGCVAHAPLSSSADSEAAEGGFDPVQNEVQAFKAELADIEVSAQKKVVQQRREVAAEPSITQRYDLAPGQNVIGEVQLIHARQQDTFSDIARTYSLGYDELVNANPEIDPWLPGEGTAIVLPTKFVLPKTERKGIVLNIAAKRLYYFPADSADGSVVYTYPIGIGRLGWATPTGSTKVTAKAKDPTWYVPWSVRQEHLEMGDPLPAIVPPGEDNPLGHRVLKLGLDGYLIHGTNQPYGVGMRVSHGCVRLYPEHIERLYEAVGLGLPVTIVNQPLLVAKAESGLVVQAYPRLEDDELTLDEHRDALLDAIPVESQERLRQSLNEVIEEARGYPVVFGTNRTRPRLVKNVVIVDNPVAQEDLAEMMALTEESLIQTAE